MNIYQEIELRTGKGLFRFYFHHFYSSSQVERFKLSAKKGAKTIVLEKTLFNMRKPWKIIAGEIVTKDPRDAAMTLLYITKRIDLYLNEHYKTRRLDNEGRSTRGHVVYFNHEDGRA